MVAIINDALPLKVAQRDVIANFKIFGASGVSTPTTVLTRFVADSILATKLSWAAKQISMF